MGADTWRGRGAGLPGVRLCCIVVVRRRVDAEAEGNRIAISRTEIEVSRAQAESRNMKKIAFRGHTLSISEWSRSTGIARQTIAMRLLRGYPVERALTEKPMDSAQCGAIGAKRSYFRDTLTK